MDLIFNQIGNYMIGLIHQLPQMDVPIDTTVLEQYAPIINYFIPFYIIAPLFKIWLSLLGAIVSAIAIWGWIKDTFH